MDETNELSIPIGADPSGLRQGFQEAERIVRSTVSNIENTVSRIGNIGQRLAVLGTTLSASLTLPIAGLATASIQAYGEIQALQKGLEAVTGSAAAAQDEFNKLKEVAKLPGLGLQEAVKGSINLQAIGISAERSRSILLQFGNAVATVGKGRVEFERAIYGVQQLANTEFPLGEDLNIIKDALPQVSNLLKEAFGSSRSDELAKMGVSSKQVLDAILTGLEKLPRVSGGIKGAFENLGDSMRTALGRIGKVIDDNFDISGIIDKITSFVDKIVKAFENLNPVVQKVIIVVAGLAAALGPLLLGIGGVMAVLPIITSGLSAMGAVFAAVLSPIGLVTAALLGVVAAVTANWDKIRPYLVETLERFKRLYNESTLFRTGVQLLGIAFEVGFKTAWTVVKNFYRNFVDFGKAVLNIFSGIGDAIEGVFTLDSDKILSGFTKVMKAPVTLFKDITGNAAAAGKEIEDSIITAVNRWSNLDVNKLKVPEFKAKASVDEDPQKSGAANIVSEVNKQIEEESKNLKPFILPLKDIDYTDVFGNRFTNTVDLYLSEAKRAIGINETLSNDFKKLNVNISESQIIFAENIAKLGESISELVRDTELQGITDLFASIGSAFANGQNALQAGAASILNTLGGFAQAFGKELIKTALLAQVFGGLVKAIQSAFANPIALIAIGAAAVAIGAALTSAARNTANTASTGGGNISGAGSVPTGSNYTSNYTSNGNFGNSNVRYLRLEGRDLVAAFNANVRFDERVNAG